MGLGLGLGGRVRLVGRAVRIRRVVRVPAELRCNRVALCRLRILARGERALDLAAAAAFLAASIAAGLPPSMPMTFSSAALAESPLTYR